MFPKTAAVKKGNIIEIAQNFHDFRFISQQQETASFIFRVRGWSWRSRVRGSGFGSGLPLPLPVMAQDEPTDSTAGAPPTGHLSIVLTGPQGELLGNT